MPHLPEFKMRSFFFSKIYLKIGGNIIIMHEVYLFSIGLLVEDGQLVASFLIFS